MEICTCYLTIVIVRHRLHILLSNLTFLHNILELNALPANRPIYFNILHFFHKQVSLTMMIIADILFFMMIIVMIIFMVRALIMVMNMVMLFIQF